MRFLALLLAAALPALAQDQGVQRQLIQRQQQSDTFQLQLRQSQERLQVAPGDLRRQQELDARQTNERQRLDDVSARQLIEVKPDTPQELRPYERQRMDEERRPLVWRK
jgi:multidrug resistance efflux pump